MLVDPLLHLTYLNLRPMALQYEQFEPIRMCFKIGRPKRDLFKHHSRILCKARDLPNWDAHAASATWRNRSTKENCSVTRCGQIKRAKSSSKSAIIGIIHETRTERRSWDVFVVLQLLQFHGGKETSWQNMCFLSFDKLTTLLSSRLLLFAFSACGGLCTDS